MNNFIKQPAVVFLLFFSFFAVKAQTNQFDIKWIGEYSSAKSLSKAESFTGRVYNFIFGEDIRKIVRPISLFTANGYELWIIDQGSRQVVYIDTLKSKFDFYQNEKQPFLSPLGLCSFGGKKLLITDSQLNKLIVFNKVNNTFNTLNDTLSLHRPTGIAYNARTEKIWLAETAKHRILILDKNGNLLKAIGKRGLAQGEYNFPTFIWIDKTGTVYVVDSMNFRVQILNAEGEVKQVFGEIGDASGYFARPKGIATDSQGHIYVTDALFHAVQIFDKKGNLLFYFGSQGRGRGQFWMPSGLFIDNKDRIYVSDSYNSRIQVFQLIKK